MNGFVVVRPEPGNTATVAALRAAGHDVMAQPLFEIAPVAWIPPDPARFDALLLTSANAIRHGGDGLAAFVALPVVAVGEATATAARNAGFTVTATGTGDAREAIAIAKAQGLYRLLHLAGRDRNDVAQRVRAVVVYASNLLPVAAAAPPSWRDRTVLLHSARAARQVAALAGTGRSSIDLVALSDTILAEAGPGWRSGVAAARPTETDLLDLAMQAAN